MDNRAETEAAVTRRVLDLLGADQGDVPISIAAGALMRASVLLAVEVAGPEGAPEACRQALENIITDLTTDARRKAQ